MLGALGEALEVLAVHEHHGNRHEHRQDARGRILLTREGLQQDGVEDQTHDRAEGHETGARHDDDENEEAEKAGDGGDHEDDHSRGGHALAALELEEDGEHVAHHDEKARNGRTELIHVVVGYVGGLVGDDDVGTHHEVAERNRNDRLEHVTQQGQHGGALAVGAEHVGGARVSASVGADIVVEFLVGDDETEVHTAQKVGNDDAEQNTAQSQKRGGSGAGRIQLVNEVGYQSPLSDSVHDDSPV